MANSSSWAVLNIIKRSVEILTLPLVPFEHDTKTGSYIFRPQNIHLNVIPNHLSLPSGRFLKDFSKFGQISFHAQWWENEGK